MTVELVEDSRGLLELLREEVPVRVHRLDDRLVAQARLMTLGCSPAAMSDDA